MANGITGSDAQPNNPGDGIVKQANTKRKPKPNRTKPRTDTRTTSPAEVKPQETPYILDEVTSQVARENVDIRLKAAAIESLPDENVMVAGAASMLLLLLDGVGMMAFGDFARLNDTEKIMVEEPLRRMLSKVSPASLNMIGKYSDPVLLSMGLLAWISRVTNESKRRKEDSVKPPKTEPEPMALTPEPPKPVDTINTNPPAEIIGNMQVSGIIL